ncbi:MAG: EAL domain-containing protein [Roseobacter sp.]
MNDRLGNFRAAHTPSDTSGKFVFVAIDAASIQSVGAWPWSRQVHADILEQLTSAGAIDVFFDVDFAFSSDTKGDEAFATALERSSNTYLPVFLQSDQAGVSEQVVNRPLQLFANYSWPALVNIFSDRNGNVRFYPYGATIYGEYTAAAAALLTGSFSERTDSFPINFSLKPESIPTLSAIDVASGAFDPTVVAGRSVVVGASAIELGDLFTVPVHGIIPGPLVHVLAAETLATDAVPRILNVEWVLLGLLAAMLILQMKLFRKPAIFLSTAMLVLLASEAFAFGVFAHRAVLVPTGVLYPSFLVFCSWALLRRLKQNNWTISRQKHEVANTSALLQQVFNDSFDAISILDETGVVRMYSTSAKKLFGLDEAGHLVLPKGIKKKALVTMQSGETQSVQKYETFRNSQSLHLEYSVTPSFTSSFERGREIITRIATLSIRDVTKIKEQEREIAYLSSYDALTGALRRSVFLDFLDMRSAAGDSFAIFVFNLSRFKTVNVVLGREIGDALLKQLVVRLQEAELNVSALARLGGDTFACFSEFETDEAQAFKFAELLCGTIEQPYVMENSQAQVGVRMGYACVSPGCDFVATDALSHAEEALDAARIASGDLPLSYNPLLSQKQFRSREIERALGRALDREEFEVWYQPQHRLNDLKLIGSEALLRWKSASLGQVYPDEFIEIAESTGFINELGVWVLERSMKDMLTLPEDLTVAVNVSSVQMMTDGIVTDVNRLLHETGFSASRLCLELTETVLVDGTGDLLEKMRDIEFRGVSWALDDFGTGYSSLGYLSQLPINKLKVDKSFMLKLGTDPSAEPILIAVSDLCRGLGLTLLCEGVENKEHLAFLKKHHYAEAQGYLFSRPMKFEDFSAYSEAERQCDEGNQAKSN